MKARHVLFAVAMLLLDRILRRVGLSRDIV